MKARYKWPLAIGLTSIVAGVLSTSGPLASVLAFHRQHPQAFQAPTGPRVHSAFMQAVLHAGDLPFHIEPEEEMAILGEHTLTFGGGDDQNTNVSLSVASLNGIRIPPGGVFSFNEIVGERSLDRGFRPGLMYISGEVVSGVGGGVCIPATAVYVAALRADMEIVERHHHSGPVSYAEPGLDAAVVYGLKDLRFRNTSTAPVTIRTMLLGTRLDVRLEGRPEPGRTVELSREGFGTLSYSEVKTPDPEVPEGEPVVDQEGRVGYTVRVVRTVSRNGRVVRRETVSRDVVAARDRIVRINPVDDPDSPEAAATPESETTLPDEMAGAATAPNQSAEEATPEEPGLTPVVRPQAQVPSTPSPKVIEPPKPVRDNPAVPAPQAPAPSAPSHVEPPHTPVTVPAPPPPPVRDSEIPAPPAGS